MHKYIPYNPRLRERARELRNNQTPAEKKLWYQFLSNYSITFTRQKPHDEYIVDFYCSDAKLVVEIDGDTHYSDTALEYDKNRTKRLAEFGIKVVRFTNFDVANHFEGVCQLIDSEVHKRINMII